MLCSGSRISSLVPQPCDGRCWKSPRESRSPCVMLRSFDSWKAVARAIDTARAGIPRRTPTAAMRVAFSACSVDRSTVTPPTSARQPSGSGSGPAPRRTSSPTPTATARATTTRTTRNRPASSRGARRSVQGSVVRMQGGVQGDPVALPRHRLDRAGGGVAAEQDVARSREVAGLQDPLGVAVADEHLRAGRDVAVGLDDAVVAQRDADAGVGAEQAALADGDDLLAAARQGPHDRGAATHVGPVADDDPGADP